ncbi:ribose-5-phosphate isomerase RpiA [Dyadobacter psychrotolerans]|uniref:Ribose-5-phosphate isomerase A n=1 Tax=Dyadobacter psychrotolerans TaxID=2541721 RepID=A0A4R5DN29_9BACT|nr:ribose-5-phosphate isomerase RpiA [Dyadobacter psychrotolerans]TDE13391.1 ribose-5-phosphate isomerase RpiA [Dyadobacter psychrotolerans]
MIDSKQQEKREVALKAAELVKDGNIVGLGSGSTMDFVIVELGRRIKDGLQFTGVASSLKTERLADSYGISMQELGMTSGIDISIDGANEFTEQLHLIKGGGGSLFREKIVASLSNNTIIVTDSTKKVNQLGQFGVPVEVVPSAYEFVKKQLIKLGGNPIIRKSLAENFITDNGNFVFDVDFGIIGNPACLAQQLDGIVGILEHGLFVSLTTKILMANGNEVVTFT